MILLRYNKSSVCCEADSEGTLLHQQSCSKHEGHRALLNADAKLTRFLEEYKESEVTGASESALWALIDFLCKDVFI